MKSANTFEQVGPGTMTYRFITADVPHIVDAIPLLSVDVSDILLAVDRGIRRRVRYGVFFFPLHFDLMIIN